MKILDKVLKLIDGGDPMFEKSDFPSIASKGDLELSKMTGSGKGNVATMDKSTFNKNETDKFINNIINA